MMQPPATDAVLDASRPGTGAPSVRSGAEARLGATVFETLDAAGPVWRDLEARAVFTPYQHFDWIAAWHEAGGTSGRLAVVVIEADGRAVALLPLEIGRRLGLRRATLIGAEMGNADWMVLDPGAAPLLTRERIAGLLAEAGRAVGGIDLVSLYDQPAQWGGVANPLLAFPHQAGPDHFHFGSLDGRPSFDRFDDKRLANLNRRKRKLAEMLGPVELRAATTVEEIDRMHHAFLEQRAARFAQMGVANIFSEPRFVRFMREAPSRRSARSGRR